MTTFDFYREFVKISQGILWAEWLVFTFLLTIAALVCGAMITHALVSLWQGTPFIKDLVDYEPESAVMN